VSMRYCFLAVEGPHDVEFIARILESLGLEKIREYDNLEPVLQDRLVPKKWPAEGDLFKRHPAPMFLKSRSHWIVLRSAEGDSKLVQAVRDGVFALRDEAEAFSSVGVIRDSDKGAPFELVAGVRNGVLDFLPHLPLEAGVVTHGTPSCGVYVIPDNRNQGTLEDVLLPCAAAVYSGLLAGAQHYIDGVDYGALDRRDQKDINKPAGRKKAVLGCVANVLKPGKSIVASIDDNRWVEGLTLEFPPVQAVSDFLKELCGLP
jgi:hypothetical protein